MNLLRDWKDCLLHLAFPHVCEGCNSDRLDSGQLLCLRCLSDLPSTNFQFYPANPIEKLFWGRLPVTHATAQFYFTRESLMQHLVHQFKYRSNLELGIFLGRLMGSDLAGSNRFSYLDGLIPLPLHLSKQHKRGFNQADILARGVSDILNIPVLEKVIRRISYSESQTRKGRVERWQNMENRFQLIDPGVIGGKHILLVDDVITTGATLEACGREILKACDVSLSVATLCYSSH